jgi:hypothetical protein
MYDIAILSSAIGVLYLGTALGAAMVALSTTDKQRRDDAIKVLTLLLSALPQFRPRP